jgi:hypothetical protein
MRFSKLWKSVSAEFPLRCAGLYGRTYYKKPRAVEIYEKLDNEFEETRRRIRNLRADLIKWALIPHLITWMALSRLLVCTRRKKEG